MTRVLFIVVLSQSAWWIAEGLRCLLTGSYANYGLWTLPWKTLGVHPNSVAPMILGLGIFGVASLLLYWKKRLLGWAGLVAFSVAALFYPAVGTVLGLLALVSLFMPKSRAALH